MGKIPDCDSCKTLRTSQYFKIGSNGAALVGYFSSEELLHIASHLEPEPAKSDLAGPHSCDQACCAKIPGKYCADDECNCGLAGNHATLPPEPT